MFAERIARVIVLALSLGIGGAYVIVRAGEFQPADTTAYWDAAMRLRDGAPLYEVVQDPDAPDVYRYAPWFALSWVPLTYLPRDAVFVVWWVGMLVAAGYVCWRVARLGAAGVAIVGLVGPFLIWIAERGNVHPLIVLLLLVGVEGRAGPALVGAAASLKAPPLAFALVYLGRRQWRRFLVAVGVFAVLTLPALAFGTTGYQLDPGRDPNPIYVISPSLWFGVVGLLCLATIVTAARWPAHARMVGGIARGDRRRSAVPPVQRHLPARRTRPGPHLTGVPPQWDRPPRRRIPGYGASGMTSQLAS